MILHAIYILCYYYSHADLSSFILVIFIIAILPLIEMATKDVLFRGYSDIDQIHAIFRMLGIVKTTAPFIIFTFTIINIMIL